MASRSIACRRCYDDDDHEREIYLSVTFMNFLSSLFTYLMMNFFFVDFNESIKSLIFAFLIFMALCTKHSLHHHLSSFLYSISKTVMLLSDHATIVSNLKLNSPQKLCWKRDGINLNINNITQQQQRCVWKSMMLYIKWDY